MKNTDQSKSNKSDRKEDTYFIISYRDTKEDKIIECKAKTIMDSTLGLSFVAISDFVFTSLNSVVVDPTEEYLQKRLENVKSLHLSIYNIISVEEVGMGHDGLKFQNDRSNLLVLNIDKSRPETPI